MDLSKISKEQSGVLRAPTNPSLAAEQTRVSANSLAADRMRQSQVDALQTRVEILENTIRKMQEHISYLEASLRRLQTSPGKTPAPSTPPYAPGSGLGANQNSPQSIAASNGISNPLKK